MTRGRWSFASEDHSPKHYEALLEAGGDGRDGVRLHYLQIWHEDTAPVLAVPNAVQLSGVRARVGSRATGLLLRRPEESHASRPLALPEPVGASADSNRMARMG